MSYYFLWVPYSIQTQIPPFIVNFLQCSLKHWIQNLMFQMFLAYFSLLCGFIRNIIKKTECVSSIMDKTKIYFLPMIDWFCSLAAEHNWATNTEKNWGMEFYIQQFIPIFVMTSWIISQAVVSKYLM